MRLQVLKEEFEDVKRKYEWTKSKKLGQFIVSKSDLEFMLDAMDYLLDEKLKTQPQKIKEKEPSE